MAWRRIYGRATINESVAMARVGLLALLIVNVYNGHMLTMAPAGTLSLPARPAIGYVRVSTEEQAREGLSLEAQRARILAACAAHGLVLGEVLLESGESGKTLHRPQLQQLLDRVRAGQVGAVVITKLDRLTRRTRDLLELVEDVFKPHGVELVSLSEQLDTRTPAGVLMLTVLGALAQMEREQIAKRTRSALRYKRDKGERLGTTPLGYQTAAAGAPMVPDLVELAAVRLILRRRRSGLSFRRIAAELAAAGYRTKRGGQWHASTIRTIWARRAAYRPLLAATQHPAAG
jgi:site-specific DNA recombinase